MLRALIGGSKTLSRKTWNQNIVTRSKYWLTIKSVASSTDCGPQQQLDDLTNQCFVPNLNYNNIAINGNYSHWYNSSNALPSTSVTKMTRKSQEEQANKILSKMNVNIKIDWNDWKSVKNEFSKVLEYYINDFIGELCCEINDSIIRSETLKRMKFMLKETNIGAKHIRGIITISSYFYIKKFMLDNNLHLDNNNNYSYDTMQYNGMETSRSSRSSNDDYKLLYERYGVSSLDLHNVLAMASVIEVLQSCALVLDDIMDNSVTRRGALCWYRRSNIGLKAINDGKFIQLLSDWLVNYRIYTDIPICTTLQQMIHKVKVLTTLGQSIDLELIDFNDQNNCTHEKLKEYYSMERYVSLVTFKTAFYTFYLPYVSALYLVGLLPSNENKELFGIVSDLSVELGLLFQSQDDYLDCFGNERITGKKGSDIEDGKCSWLFVQALLLCNKEDFNNILYKYYAKNDYDAVYNIKQLYEQLKIPMLYNEHQKNMNKEISHLIESINKQLPRAMFEDVLQKINDRQK